MATKVKTARSVRAKRRAGLPVDRFVAAAEHQAARRAGATADPDDIELEVLDATAAQWVAALRHKLSQLADALGVLDAIGGHPDPAQGRLVLGTVLRPEAVCKLVALVDEALKQADELLDEAVVEQFPPMAGIVGAAARRLEFARGEAADRLEAQAKKGAAV
jgi:hypothetical protein